MNATRHTDEYNPRLYGLKKFIQYARETELLDKEHRRALRLIRGEETYRQIISERPALSGKSTRKEGPA